jgi:hypothetical protein
MAISLKQQPLSDVSDLYLVSIHREFVLTLQNMKMQTAQKRLAYQESIWAVKEIDLIEDKRKLELRIGMKSIKMILLTSSCVGAGNRELTAGPCGIFNES